MNWDDTIGQYIHARMYNKALEVKPDADKQKLNDSIKRASLTVGITRQSIADIVDAEASSVAMLRVLGDDQYTIDFLAGMLAIGEFIRTGKHITGE
jgi:hypothetical protein